MSGNADKISPKKLPHNYPQLQIPPKLPRMTPRAPRVTLCPNLLLLSRPLLAQLVLLVLLLGVLVVVVLDVGVVVVVVLVVVVVVIVIVGVLIAHQGRGDPNSCACT